LAAEPLILPAVAVTEETPPPWRLWWLIILALSLMGWAVAIVSVGLLMELCQ
jgi:hypothetical protein